MRTGLIGRWAAVTGAVLVTGACSQVSGLAGVGATSPASIPAGATPPAATTTAQPVPSAEPQAAAGEQQPKGDDPIMVPPPKLSEYTYAFPVKGCKTTYQRKLLVLPKTTIWAARGCAFVAPIDGVVHEVSVQNLWNPATDNGAQREGRFVTIIGEDGVRYLGGHLDSVAEGIKPGERVKAGQVLGKVGNSGNARDTAPNLYFAISWKTGPAYWWVRRGMVKPWDYLDAWRTGNRTLSPREETLKLRTKLGETPACSTLCGGRQVFQAQPTPSRSQTPRPRRERERERGGSDSGFTLSPIAPSGQ
ncbi:M23 family metallopeptidase [Nonomuraea jiangxiensis]|uniref:Peptidase family M23 n=1 Tax=Nonomuraea jiangxiensis TaxID=633440 RepID=A0A1G7YXN6_9ACTN|nr:M23 family metallopeptidase [Nonomuraea jiangxiensis]SDH00610.1 Peptidase family M23 [Nonomuraea jiangxiensis]